MAQASLDKLAKALDQVEARLAKIEGKLGGGSSASAGAGSGGASVDAWDSLVSSHIPKFVTDSKAIASDVGQHVRTVSVHASSHFVHRSFLEAPFSCHVALMWNMHASTIEETTSEKRNFAIVLLSHAYERVKGRRLSGSVFFKKKVHQRVL